MVHVFGKGRTQVYCELRKQMETPLEPGTLPAELQTSKQAIRKKVQAVCVPPEAEVNEQEPIVLNSVQHTDLALETVEDERTLPLDLVLTGNVNPRPRPSRVDPAATATAAISPLATLAADSDHGAGLWRVPLSDSRAAAERTIASVPELRWAS